MKIELKEITVREIAENYVDNAEEGVIGYNGKLNIRPKYQREFVYKDDRRNAVIDTIRKNFPLNILYWVVNDDGTYEVLDGQQRIISFCQYVHGNFSMEIDNYAKAFPTLTETEQKQILDYKLMVYCCEGTAQEKLDWFRIVNITGEKLTDQELRNAAYTGAWLSDAKSKFSKNNCAAYLLANKYVNGSPIRQELLETALDWISKGEIEDYMSSHQHDPNANELWAYFKNVIDWAMLTFPNYRKEMNGLNWSSIYDNFKDEQLDSQELEEEIQRLMMDDDVFNKRSIYSYVLTRNKQYLNIRTFTDGQKSSAYEQ